MNSSLPHTDHKIPMPPVKDPKPAEHSFMPPKPADLRILIYTQEILLWCSTFRTAFDTMAAQTGKLGYSLGEAREAAEIAVGQFRIVNDMRDLERHIS